jgi:hypothetical protein
MSEGAIADQSMNLPDKPATHPTTNLINPRERRLANIAICSVQPTPISHERGASEHHILIISA